MRVVSLVTCKGGAGKSTLAASLAVAAKDSGEKVFILDMDPLGSVIHWSTLRQADDIPVSAIDGEQLKEALNYLKKQQFTFVLLDTPAGENTASEKAIAASDLCIIPTRPNLFDLKAGEKTLKLIKKSKKDFAFLLNQCPPAQQSARVSQGIAALETLGALVSPLLSSRVDYQEAVRHGLGVTEFRPKGAAASEIRQLHENIKARLEEKTSQYSEPKVDSVEWWMKEPVLHGQTHALGAKIKRAN